MKKGKGLLRGVLLLAAVVILLLLLTMCARSRGGGAEEVLPAMAAESSVPIYTTATAEETVLTVPTEEATEQTEETATETTAETTVPPDEEPTETSAPSDEDDEDKYEDEEDYGEEEPVVEVPAPGTPENPYVALREEYPAEIESVNIPRDTDVSYVISGSAGSVITIRDPDVTLTLDGKSYTADKTTGELTVDLSKLGKDPLITLSHSGKTAASCVLSLSEGLGNSGNPEPLTVGEELAITLPEGDSDGYHYLWTSDIIGQVELSRKEKTPPAGEDSALPEAVLEVIVTIGEQVTRLSECEDGKLLFDTVKDQQVMIQVIAQPLPDGTYPPVEETLLFTRLPVPGSEENPIAVESIETISVALEDGNADGIWFRWTADTYGMVTLTADREKLAVAATVGESVYTGVDGVVEFHAELGQPVRIRAVAVPQAGETDTPVYPAVNAEITGTVAPDLGTPGNPVVLRSIGSIPTTLAQNDRDGHTYRWTASYSGVLELTVREGKGDFDVILTHSPSGTVQKLSESRGKLTMKLAASDTVDIQVIAMPDRNGQYGAAKVMLVGRFTGTPGSSPENPITIAEGQTAAVFSMEANQTLYFSGMVQEMVATVENASGVTISCDEKTAWAGQSGVAQMEFPSEGEEPVSFSVTSKNEKELTMTLSYPAGHEKNPARLLLGETVVVLEENDADGYLLDWTADCDGQLTVSVEGAPDWQYQLVDLTAETSGERVTGAEPQTVEVKSGTTLRLTLWTLAEEGENLPSGELTVRASFFDPLLGTEAKPIRLEAGGKEANTVTVPAGETLYYSAAAEGMRLSFAGTQVTLVHNGSEYLPENGTLELMCHGMDSVFAITNSSEQEQTCKFVFSHPEGHLNNPAKMVLGENTASLEDGSLSGYTFAWTAEGTGLLIVTMAEDAGWQYRLTNETAGVTGVIHTSEDQPAAVSETLNVTMGDQILVTVNTFDQEKPLNAPAGEVTFTAEFVDPTLGMEENPVWLNLEDSITIPAGKTMYCTAKADGMVLTLTGSGVTVSHNGADYFAQQGAVRLLCEGTGIFGHPVFAVTNGGETERTYGVSFTYPEGHCQNPALLKLEKNSVEPGKNGYCFLWTAEEDGTFDFTVESEAGWKYLISNVTAGTAGELRSADDEEPVFTQTEEVKAGDQLRILVHTTGEPGVVEFTPAFTPKTMEETEQE